MESRSRLLPNRPLHESESFLCFPQQFSTNECRYNAASHPVPFMKASNVTAPVKAAAKEAPDLEEAIEEDDDAQAAEPVEAADDDEIDFKKDKYIKQPKKKPAAKKASAKADADDDDVGAKKGRGRPKAANSKEKGKK